MESADNKIINDLTFITESCEITNLKNKLISITKSHKHEHYDIEQFFTQALESQIKKGIYPKEYLGEFCIKGST